MVKPITPRKFSKTPGVKKPLTAKRVEKLRKVVPKVQRKEMLDKYYEGSRAIARQERQILTSGHFNHPRFTDAVLKNSLKKNGVKNPEAFIKNMLKKRFEIVSLTDTAIKMIESRSVSKATKIKKDYNNRVRAAGIVFQEKYNSVLSSKINRFILGELKKELSKHIEGQIKTINSLASKKKELKKSASLSETLSILRQMLHNVDPKNKYPSPKLDLKQQLSFVSKELKKFYETNKGVIGNSAKVDQKILSIEKFQKSFNQDNGRRYEGHIPNRLKSQAMSFAEKNSRAVLKEVFNDVNLHDMRDRAKKEYGIEKFWD